MPAPIDTIAFEPSNNKAEDTFRLIADEILGKGFDVSIFQGVPFFDGETPQSIAALVKEHLSKFSIEALQTARAKTIMLKNKSPADSAQRELAFAGFAMLGGLIREKSPRKKPANGKLNMLTVLEHPSFYNSQTRA